MSRMKTVKTAFFYQFTLPSGTILHIDNEEAGDWIEQLQARVQDMKREYNEVCERRHEWMQRAEKAEAALATVTKEKDALRELLCEARAYVVEDHGWSYEDPTGWLSDRIDAALTKEQK
jgi:crotonobetainyl-CoA:carnitine CoA-transferase CaiB-like acyl-CoA transferase